MWDRNRHANEGSDGQMDGRTIHIYIHDGSDGSPLKSVMILLCQSLVVRCSPVRCSTGTR